MKQVIMFNTLTPQLVPSRIYSRGQVVTLLPRETVMVCIRLTNHRAEFIPQQIYKPEQGGTVCYLVKNTTVKVLRFRNVSLHTLLKHKNISHKMLILPVETVIQMHKKWLRGRRVWYPLRKMFILSQHFQ
jgi:hypothetical protein